MAQGVVGARSHTSRQWTIFHCIAPPLQRRDTFTEEDKPNPTTVVGILYNSEHSLEAPLFLALRLPRHIPQ